MGKQRQVDGHQSQDGEQEDGRYETPHTPGTEAHGHQHDGDARRAHREQFEELTAEGRGAEGCGRVAGLYQKTQAQESQHDVEDLGGRAAGILHLRRARHGGQGHIEDRDLVFRGHGLAQGGIRFSPEASHVNAPS